MIKSFRNTVVASLLLFLIMYAIFIVITNKGEVDITHKMDKIMLNEDQIADFQVLVNNNELLRNAYMINSEIENDDMLKFILTNLEKEHYENIVGYFNESICSINWVGFSYSPGCNFIKINNETIMEYQKKYFNTSKALVFNPIEYKGLECKNDETAYYCLIKEYNESNIKKYSVIDSAYSDSEKFVIRDYYVNVKTDDINECRKYFDNNDCSNYNNNEEINHDKVIENGSLFEYVFLKEGDHYYISDYRILK